MHRTIRPCPLTPLDDPACAGEVRGAGMGLSRPLSRFHLDDEHDIAIRVLSCGSVNFGAHPCGQVSTIGAQEQLWEQGTAASHGAVAETQLTGRQVSTAGMKETAARPRTAAAPVARSQKAANGEASQHSQREAMVVGPQTAVAPVARSQKAANGGASQHSRREATVVGLQTAAAPAARSQKAADGGGKSAQSAQSSNCGTAQNSSTRGANGSQRVKHIYWDSTQRSRPWCEKRPAGGGSDGLGSIQLSTARLGLKSLSLSLLFSASLFCSSTSLSR
jgi:hypothetical protein